MTTAQVIPLATTCSRLGLDGPAPDLSDGVWPSPRGRRTARGEEGGPAGGGRVSGDTEDLHATELPGLEVSPSDVGRATAGHPGVPLIPRTGAPLRAASTPQPAGGSATGGTPAASLSTPRRDLARTAIWTRWRSARPVNGRPLILSCQVPGAGGDGLGPDAVPVVGLDSPPTRATLPMQVLGVKQVSSPRSGVAT